jgi:hypothetical protein
MRVHLGLGLAAAFVALPGCGTSPTAPAQTGQALYDPTALFERLAGPYSLTFTADDGCPLPAALKVLTYDVTLERTPFRYLAVRVPGKNFVGDLWISGTANDGLTLRWNMDCDAHDTAGSTSFILGGQGLAPVTDAEISGVLQGNFYRDFSKQPYCPTGAHRFAFKRRE